MRPHFAYKCVVLGQSGTGKSSILIRQIHNRFVTGMDSTIGAAFYVFKREMEDRKIQLEMWDTAGQERYHSLVDMYIRNADVILLVYDVNDPESLEELTKKWIPYLDRNANLYSPTAIKILVANKMDLYTGQPEHPIANDIDNAKFSFYQTSAKNGSGVHTMFEDVFTRLAQKNPPCVLAEPKLLIKPVETKPKPESGCCW